MLKLGSQALRKSNPGRDEIEKIKRNPLYLVLDNVIDTYNIGSLFRLADAVAAKKIYLCGNMEYPPSSRIHKAAVGTENWVPWEKTDSAWGVVEKLKKQNVTILAVEQDKRSILYSKLNKNIVKFPLALVVGSESLGIDKKILDNADIIVELPMFGINKSFNVWGSAAVVAYKIMEFLI